MDPLSTAAACISLASVVTKVTFSISDLVYNTRDVRRDLDAASRELISLKTVLEALSKVIDDETQFSDSLIRQLSRALNNCGRVLEQIQNSVDKHSGGGVR